MNLRLRVSAAVAAISLLVAAGCRGRDSVPDEAQVDDAAAPADAATPADAAPADAAETAFVACPASPGVREDPDALLDMAVALQDEGEHGAAVTCADLAAELVPRAVEAYHVRASSLAALGRHDEARAAFSMALNLDPDDPDTLAAAADYYINHVAERRRDTTLLGLSYARRGAEAVTAMWREDDPAHGELLLRKAQAKNDLGRPDEALEAVERALSLGEHPAEAHHERGVSLFHLSRFEAAEEAFETFVDRAEGDPREAYAHFHLGLIAERAGDDARAAERFARAARLSGGELREPLDLSEEAFAAHLEAAVASLSRDERADLDGVDIEVADLPSAEDLRATEPPLSPTILGLYRGLPHGARDPSPGGSGDAGGPPEPAIVLYRNNLARVAADTDDLSRQIRDTLRHEIGHLRGLTEAELRRRGLD